MAGAVLTMIRIRKRESGNDSFGNSWPEDGSAIEVPVEQAIALLAIKDGGFSEAPEPYEPQDSNDDGNGDDPPAPPDDTEPEPVQEPAPDPDNAIDEAPKPRGRKPAAKKTVEE